MTGGTLTQWLIEERKAGIPMGSRLEKLRWKINSMVMKTNDCAGFFSHLYSVSMFATMLARKRGLDPEIAAVCGMLHDIYQVTAGTGEQHAAEGAKVAAEMLRQANEYSDEEIEIITTAISWHSKKLKFHGPYDELLKDADVMSHYFYNLDFAMRNKDSLRYLQKGSARYESLLLELGIGPPQQVCD